MPPALQVISGRATNPSTTLTALTMNTGDSATVKNFQNGKAYILNMWAKEGTVGDFRIRSPLLHEATQGIRARVPLAAKCRPLLPFDTKQPLQAQDTLTMEITGGGAEVDVAAALIYYEDLLGAGEAFIGPSELSARMVHMVVVNVPITSGGTAGQYGGGAALNSSLSILKANTGYAILGFNTDVELANIGLYGPDTSNLRMGCPGSTDAYLTSSWFVWLSHMYNMSLIPVINSANQANTTVDVLDTATGTSININVILAQLSGSPPATSLA